MANKKIKLMRTLQFVPGHNQKLIDSGAKSDADIILFDLEDSVQPAENKLKARDLIIDNIRTLKFEKFEIYIRLNEIETEFFLQDVLRLTEANITGFLLSKTNTEDDVKYLDNLLTSIELERGLVHGYFKIIPILESALSIVNINTIAISSKRIVALGYGSEDYVSDIEGVRDFNTNVSIDLPRKLVPIVARANNLEAIDAAYIKVHDLEGLIKHANEGKVLGYSGMWILHPKQNSLANTVYSPTKEEFDDSMEFLRLYGEAKNINKGVAIIEGRFVGPPLIRKANDIIAKAKLIRAKDEK